MRRDTEAMRSDEVPHHTEVQAFRKEGSTEMVDMAEDKAGALGRVCGETQGYSSYRGRSLGVGNTQEKSAEVIVVAGKRAVRSAEVSLGNEGPNVS